MYISQQLKKQNIAEYLLYMWQVEDLIRANNFDMEKIRETSLILILWMRNIKKRWHNGMKT